MTYISIEQWRNSSAFGRSIQLPDHKIEGLLWEKKVDVARINGKRCAEEATIDNVVQNHVAVLAKKQTSEGVSFAERTKERNLAERHILLVGALVLSMVLSNGNPVKSLIVNNRWCDEPVLDKRVNDIIAKEGRKAADITGLGCIKVEEK